MSDKTSIWCRCENNISPKNDYCIKCGRKIAHPEKVDIITPTRADCEVRPAEIIYPKKLTLNEKISKYGCLTVVIFVVLCMIIAFLINPSDFKFQSNSPREFDPANMSKKEFNQYWDDLNKRQQEKIDNQKAFPDK